MAVGPRRANGRPRDHPVFLRVMTTFYRAGDRPAASARPAAQLPLSAADLLRRRPTRVTTTLSWDLHQRLQARADLEGRSLSNLTAHLLEVAMSVHG